MLADISAALSRGDAPAAIESARALIAAEPDNAQAHHLLALALKRQGDLAAAREAIDRAISLAPERAMFQLSRASLDLAQGDLERAEQGMREAVALDPNQLPAYVTLVHLALAQGRNQEAEAQLKLAQRVDPEHPQVRVAEGHLAQLKGQADHALACFTAAVEADPGFALGQVSLGLAYLQRGHYAFAEQALVNAVALDAGNPGVLRALLEAYRRQDKLAEAVGVLDRLLAHYPSPDMRALRGQLWMALGRGDEALLDLLAVLDSHPGHVVVLDMAVNALVRAGRLDEAIARVEAAIASSGHRDAYWALRLALAEPTAEGNRAILARWAEAMPDSALCLDQRAHFHEQLGEADTACDLARQALARAPGLPSSELLLLRWEIGNAPEAALEHLGRLQPAKEDAASWRTLLGFRGLALDRLGRSAEAVAAWAEMSRIRAASYLLPMPAAAESLPEGEAAGTLLWAPPGVRIEPVLAAVAPQLAGRLLLDRPTAPQGRQDGYGIVRGRPGSPEAGTPARWREALAAAGVDPTMAVDWLPHFDAYTAASLRGATTVACLIDPRDALLNWMVYGNALGYVFLPDPQENAEWLARCLEALADHRDAHPEAVRIIALDTAVAAPQALAAALQAAFGLPELPVTELLAGPMRGAGGLPLQFAPGHWRQYREALAAPFARLAAVAQRLGYPAE